MKKDLGIPLNLAVFLVLKYLVAESFKKGKHFCKSYKNNKCKGFFFGILIKTIVVVCVCIIIVRFA